MPMPSNFGLLTPLLAPLGTVNVLNPLIFAEVTFFAEVMLFFLKYLSPNLRNWGGDNYSPPVDYAP